MCRQRRQGVGSHLHPSAIVMGALREHHSCSCTVSRVKALEVKRCRLFVDGSTLVPRLRAIRSRTGLMLLSLAGPRLLPRVKASLAFSRVLLSRRTVGPWVWLRYLPLRPRESWSTKVLAPDSTIIFPACVLSTFSANMSACALSMSEVSDSSEPTTFTRKLQPCSWTFQSSMRFSMECSTLIMTFLSLAFD